MTSLSLSVAVHAMLPLVLLRVSPIRHVAVRGVSVLWSVSSPDYSRAAASVDHVSELGGYAAIVIS